MYCQDLWAVPLLHFPSQRSIDLCQPSNADSLPCPQTLASLLILAAGQDSCLNMLGCRLLSTHYLIWIPYVWIGLRDSIKNFSGLQTQSILRGKKKAYCSRMHVRAFSCNTEAKVAKRVKSRVVLRLVWVNILHLGSLNVCYCHLKLREQFISQ